MPPATLISRKRIGKTNAKAASSELPISPTSDTSSVTFPIEVTHIDVVLSQHRRALVSRKRTDLRLSESQLVAGARQRVSEAMKDQRVVMQPGGWHERSRPPLAHSIARTILRVPRAVRKQAVKPLLLEIF